MQQQRHNHLFKNNQSQLYKELGGSINQKNPPLNAAEAVTFWESIWSREKEHNREVCWLNEVRRTMGGCGQQEDVVVTEEDVVNQVKRSSSWKVAGPNGVRAFWFKTFTSLHSVLATALQECLNKGHVPEWMAKGRTVLIQKDPAKGAVSSNYRPITCLRLMWKLLTGIIADKIYDHLLMNSILPYEQKGCRKGARGTKDQLLIDKVVLKEVKIFRKNVAMAYIVYRKAYDMVPHSWIFEMMEVTGVTKNVGSLSRRSMNNWCTVLNSDEKT